MDSSHENCKRTRREQGKIPEQPYDHLSNLPTDILQHILSFLDITEVVKTSLLSRKWRYIWTSVPRLNFDFRGFWKQEHCLVLSYDACLKKFWEFVKCAIIIRNTFPITKLRVLCDYYEDEQVKLFFSLCALRNVQEVDLLAGEAREELRHRPFPSDPSEPVFGISQNFCGLVNLESLKAFGNLKTLRLFKVRFRHAVISENLFSDCGILENLSMEYCSFEKINVLHISAHKLRKFNFVNRYCDLFRGHWYEFKGKLKVHTPNLVSLCYIGPLCQHWEISSDMPFLDQALVQFLGRFHAVEGMPSEMRTIVSAIHCAKELSLSESFPRYFFFSKEYCKFNYLRCLKINMEGIPIQIDGLIKLLKLSPNLEVLSIKLENLRFPWNYRGPTEGWKSRKEDVPCLANHLKEIEIFDFLESPHLLGLVSFFLENGKSLEKVKITRKTHSRMDPEISSVLRSVWLASEAISVSVFTYNAFGETEMLQFVCEMSKEKPRKQIKKLKIKSARRMRVAKWKAPGSS